MSSPKELAGGWRTSLRLEACPSGFYGEKVPPWGVDRRRSVSRAGWNIYSPHRDIGFDFIATKTVAGRVLIRPVQVKGHYPRVMRDVATLGKGSMDLNQTHDEMVLAMPFFVPEDGVKKLVTVAYLPWSQMVERPDKAHRSSPARIVGGKIGPRPYYEKFFDGPGLKMMERADWRDTPSGLE